jgi:transcriptional regulator
MHPNPIYKHATNAENIAFARELGFGMLAIAHNGAPLLSHTPFLLSQDGKTLEFHLVRSNPIARACKDPDLDTITAKLAISGPHSYGVPDQVPTWN